MKNHSVENRSAVIVSGARTPFGKLNGSLAGTSAIDLAVIASRGAMLRSSVTPDEVDQVIFGNVLQTSPDAPYGARHIGLRAGVPEEVPALTVNRLCASGFQSIVSAAEQIIMGRAKIILAGGTENMSLAPHVVRGSRQGLRLGHAEFRDSLWEVFLDSYNGLRMGETAENLAKKYKISRKASDEFSFRSQVLTREAQESGRLAEEIIHVEKESRGKKEIFDQDEHPRPSSDKVSLSRLKPFFDSHGIVTAGSSSGICDGAAAVVVMAEDEAKKRKLSTLGKLLSVSSVGVDPDFMGIGPVPSSRQALKDAGLKIGDMDLFEVNEAFSPQVIAVEKELGIPREKLNVNGGAIALGHPLGASGTRLVLTLLMELQRRGKSLGLASACVGGGQGMTLILEASPS